MSAVVLLSSSPPRAFAPSPTPVGSSSPLPSPNALLTDGIRRSQRFKPLSKIRDGFSSGFSSARSLLTTKVGAENIPLRSPGKEKFKSASTVAARGREGTGSQRPKVIMEKGELHAGTESAHFKKSGSQSQATARNHEPTAHADLYESTDDASRREAPVESARSHRDSSPLRLEQALPRRLDWTPAKPSTKASPSTSEFGVPTLGFSKEMLDNFTFTEPTERQVHKVPTKVDANGEPMKRRRIDLIMTAKSHEELSLHPVDSHQGKQPAKEGARRRTKSPTKKMLTITGLATSLYGEGQQRNATKVAPMLEYLTATQLGAEEDVDSAVDVLPKKGAKQKSGGKKARATKKAPPKSRLLSPTSAMKAIESQETLFGSASQLARDESPTLLRDTLEALKRSECFLSSDPVSPPRTQPISIESTSPSNCRGTVRFVKKRNLWSAAGRDEDNALLHVDTVDLIDSPAVRQALAGKDVLLQPAEPGLQRSASGQKGRVEHHAETPLINKAGPLIDIDDIVTPGLQPSMQSPMKLQTRSYHTTRIPDQPAGVSETAEANVPDTSPTEMVLPPTKKPVPVKPSYAGFATHELQKQISAYGFKPVKKREKMIELLERCWEDKHGVTPNDDDKEEHTEAMTHGDFLSKVHDVAARPLPKVKKPRAKRKSEAAEPKPAKEPKQRKKAEPKAKAKTTEPSTTVTKTPRKRTSKKALSDEVVMDVDDLDVEAEIDAETGSTSAQAQVTAKSTPRKRINPKPKATTASKSRTKKPATPPATLPLISFSSSPVPDIQIPEQPIPEAPGTADIPKLKRRKTTTNDPVNPITAGPKTGTDQILETTLTPEHTPPLPNLQTQIHTAIHFRPNLKSKDQGANRGRDHTVSPTWREKILMYDPIVLEDLTVWLNTEGFGSIGEDREISALEVREWCESNGICCLWRGGWRGNGQSRAGAKGD